MAQTVKINGVTYNDVKEVKLPLASDPSKTAVFPDTSDATTVAASVKDGEIFYANGQRGEGSMPVNGAGGGVIFIKDGVISIPEGYYDGSGKVVISDTEKAKIIASNIRQGVSILGVNGSMSPSEGVNAQSKTVIPTKADQQIGPDSGYTHLSGVLVKAIPSEYITTSDANAAADDIRSGKTGYVNGKKITGTHTDPTFTLTSGVLSIA